MSDVTQVWFGYIENSRHDPVPVIYWSDPAKNDMAKPQQYLKTPFMIELPAGYDPVGLLQRLASDNPPPPKFAKQVEKHNAATLDKLQTGETAMPGVTYSQQLQTKLEQAAQVIEKLHEGSDLTDAEMERVVAYLRDGQKYAEAFMIQFIEDDDGIPES